MGIYIHMEISKSVTAKEWERVYGETLQLVNAFPLSEHYEATCNGIDTYCIVRTQEHKHSSYNGEKLGWTADGDYETLRGAED